MPAALLAVDRQHGFYLAERDWTEVSRLVLGCMS
jgi:hypothetical protein